MHLGEVQMIAHSAQARHRACRLPGYADYPIKQEIGVAATFQGVVKICAFRSASPVVISQLPRRQVAIHTVSRHTREEE